MKMFTYTGAALLTAAFIFFICSQHMSARSSEPAIIYGPGLTIRGVTAPVSAGETHGDDTCGDTAGADTAGAAAPADAESSEPLVGNRVMSVGEYYTADTVMFYGKIISADPEDNSILINATRTSGETKGSFEDIIFNYIAGVPVVDAVTGLPVNITDLKAGDTVYAWSGNAMTMSLPPIVNLQALVAGTPSDAGAPVYVVAAAASYDGSAGTLTITGQNGDTYTAAAGETEVSAFKTRQRVELSDIVVGSRLMIWGNVSKITVF